MTLALTGCVALAGLMFLALFGEPISRRRVRVALACDDCPGGPGCRCADGYTDPDDCDCPPEGGAW